MMREQTKLSSQKKVIIIMVSGYKFKSDQSIGLQGSNMVTGTNRTTTAQPTCLHSGGSKGGAQGKKEGKLTGHAKQNFPSPSPPPAHDLDLPLLYRC